MMDLLIVQARGVPVLPTPLNPSWHPTAATPSQLQSARVVAAIAKRGSLAMRSSLQLLSVLCLLVAHAGAAEADWQTLFNGKDLSGWRANYYPASWSVEGGAIRARATAESSHLFYVGHQPPGKFATYTNFVLELSARGGRNSNSGLYFHTDYTTQNRKHHLANGYEVQLDSTPNEKRATGSLYAVVDLAKSPVDASQWFRVRLTVQGRRIVVQINDRTVVDYTEPANVKRPPDKAGRKLNPAGGAIALQGHDPRSTFYFKDIRIKRLP